MGILGALKNRLLGRKDELGDIRSHVLGEEELEPGFGREPPLEEGRFGPRDVPEFPEATPRFEEKKPYGGPRFGREPIAMEEREPIPIEKETSRDYEIMDRLNIIEAQLSAIRSQTETINERLKNLEMRLGRRY